MTFKVYIPARYASLRLPGKPLLSLAGKPIIQHVYDNARLSGAAEVVVSTDDDRIARVAAEFGASVVRTAGTHISGTDRIAEAVAVRSEPDDTIIVNVQGDEPQLPATVIHQVATLIELNTGVDIVTICEPIEDARELDDPNIVKVVRTDNLRAIYFSRAPIPHARGGRELKLAHYRRHVGIYAYRVKYLRQFVETAAAELELIEHLEQLRAISNNATIIVADAIAACGVGIDTRDDYERAQKYWEPSA
ncbi:MAG TPA: 3-deoxy-manno-octulosonate cytidylyltransferase [Gammaproteobacteria bacterium]|nr:3-deoxy-manno-octulosonate cytidylyltransferase [Gammaproteobacteria bacterium]